ncbi:lipoyl protein ligase domain-containing protein [Rubritalea sp.]|uniref:lipoyl protein ligase domain-containing protein n=1 Tax=Rubritalea sp. TaxID=2109375 RepID=UPI003EF6984A
MSLFSELDVIHDQCARSGAENMAVDQVLFERLGCRPLIRFYEWNEPTVSFGYFDKLSDVENIFFGGDDLKYVRRWTGGGIVDHRLDQTYTLFIPKGHEVEQLRGGASYSAVHRVLAESLRLTGVGCMLLDKDSEQISRACFERPVAFDVLGQSGEKIAGAGQKRTRNGLLHQGSVLGVEDVEVWQECFLDVLACCRQEKDIAADLLDDVYKLVAERYGSDDWLLKRP